MKLDAETFSTRFQTLLSEKGCTVHDVAVATGIADSCLSDWKRMKSKPKIDKLLLICNYFGVGLEYFVS